jgi:peptidoglycan/xylan/chitin deacetylase (PgdA/CDA1 family)
MYHEVVSPLTLASLAGKIQASYVVTLELFERHLAALQRLRANVVTAQQLLDWLEGASSLPPRSVLITFDDGYAGNYELAFPALERAGYGAVFFVATRKIGDPCMMTWQQLAEMAARGMAIESHTASHPLLSTLSRDETLAELHESKLAIERQVGRAVRLVSLPNGDSNRWYPELAESLGYRAGFGSAFGRNSGRIERYRLQRIAIKRSTSVADLEGYVTGRSAGYAWAAGKAAAKSAITGLLTKRVYDRLYNAVFGVEEQRKGPA